MILKPHNSYETYIQAVNVFEEYYKKITGLNTLISEEDDGISDLVVIGSDSVNDFLMNEVLELNIKSLGIRYGTDNYCIRTYKKDNRNVLILAGGRGRSTLYAIYDYFERFGGCHYFWDGDVISQKDSIVCDKVNPLFYRGY